MYAFSPAAAASPDPVSAAITTDFYQSVTGALAEAGHVRQLHADLLAEPARALPKPLGRQVARALVLLGEVAVPLPDVLLDVQLAQHPLDRRQQRDVQLPVHRVGAGTEQQ